MSTELSTFEAMGGTYTEVDGLFYPDIITEMTDIPLGMVGKYGLLWIDYMKSNYVERYRHHIRMGTLNIKALEVNEEASAIESEIHRVQNFVLYSVYFAIASS